LTSSHHMKNNKRVIISVIESSIHQKQKKGIRNSRYDGTGGGDCQPPLFCIHKDRIQKDLDPQRSASKERVPMGHATSAKEQEPVGVLTLRRVKPGSEERFEAALHDFISASLHSDGQLGVHVIRPGAGNHPREYGILRRFSTSQACDTFYRSALFRQWEETIAPMMEGVPVRQELSGLETWFTLPGQRAMIPPPAWKMALVTVLGVYPVSILVPWLLQPLIGDLHPLLKALFIAMGIVVVLTWAVMPVLVKILKPWLYPRDR